MRIAVIDIGTNSTRLLVADVEAGEVDAIRRESRVTGIGRGLETSGRLATEGIEAACAAIGDYVAAARELEAAEVVAIATSAVRDASNGEAFIAELRERFSLSGRVIEGLEEARLTYRGALSESAGDAGGEAETLVIDIGGGSTELIVGSGPEPSYHASLQIGVVRHSERHIRSDPPDAGGLEALAEDVGTVIGAELASNPGVHAERAIAVAGTPALLAAIELELDPFDPAAVEGHVLSLPRIQQACSKLASLSLAERRVIVGLDPDRAPTIVAGVIILIKAMRAFGIDEVIVSERDILHGTALVTAERLAGRAG